MIGAPFTCCPVSMVSEMRRAAVDRLDAVMRELGTLSRAHEEGVLLEEEHHMIATIAASVMVLRKRIEERPVTT